MHLLIDRAETITPRYVKENAEMDYEATPARPDSLKWWQKKEHIQKLRREGLSYRELIARLPFKVARGTVSRWCREIELTSEQLDRLDGLRREGSYRSRFKGAKTNQRRRAEEVERIRAEARAEIPQLTQKELWLAGLMLYWAEGSKTHQVCVTNSDPSLVRFMAWWFQEFCGVPLEKLRARLHLHSGQDEHSMKQFWSGITGIPLFQFGKSYVKKEGTGHRKNVLYQGTIQVAICNKDLLHKIHGWIEAFSGRTSGPLAQLVEHRTLNPGVACSKHARPTDLDDNIYVMDRNRGSR